MIVYWIVCPQPKIKSSSVTIYLVPFDLDYRFTALPSGNHHTVVCVYEILFVFLVCSFATFNFKSHMKVNLFKSGLPCLIK